MKFIYSTCHYWINFPMEVTHFCSFLLSTFWHCVAKWDWQSCRWINGGYCLNISLQTFGRADILGHLGAFQLAYIPTSGASENSIITNVVGLVEETKQPYCWTFHAHKAKIFTIFQVHPITACISINIYIAAENIWKRQTYS